MLFTDNQKQTFEQVLISGGICGSWHDIFFPGQEKETNIVSSTIFDQLLKYLLSADIWVENAETRKIIGTAFVRCHNKLRNGLLDQQFAEKTMDYKLRCLAVRFWKQIFPTTLLEEKLENLLELALENYTADNCNHKLQKKADKLAACFNWTDTRNIRPVVVSALYVFSVLLQWRRPVQPELFADYIWYRCRHVENACQRREVIDDVFLHIAKIVDSL